MMDNSKSSSKVELILRIVSPLVIFLYIILVGAILLMSRTIIEIHNLNYRYPGAKRLALSDVNLAFPSGNWISIIGKNGSGKSTLIKLLDGLLGLQKGRIKIDGNPLTKTTVQLIRSRIGIVFQNPTDQFVGTTVKDDLAFGLKNQQVPIDQIDLVINWALLQVGMQNFRNDSLRDLSGGEKQKIALAEVLAIKPKIIILDEFTSMFDPQSRFQILNLLKQLKDRFHLTIINITHQLSEIKYANWLTILDSGRVVLNGPKRAVLNHQLILKRAGLLLPETDRLNALLNQRGLVGPKRHLNEKEMLIWIKQLF